MFTMGTMLCKYSSFGMAGSMARHEIDKPRETKGCTPAGHEAAAGEAKKQNAPGTSNEAFNNARGACCR